MLRFKVGELAIVAVGRGKKSLRLIGEEVRIHCVGPFRSGDTFLPSDPTKLWGQALQDGDYACTSSLGGFMAMDWQLRKIDPPAEPASLTHQVEEEIAA
jgi:hypothetical protein